MDNEPYHSVGVIGGGAWGTALAMVAALAGRQVTVWAREAEVVDSINAARRNERYLPGVELPRGLGASARIEDAAAQPMILVVVPAQHLRATLTPLAGSIAPGTPVVLAAKGIERGSGKLMTEVLAECLPRAVPAILSGPSFAVDVARGLPTAVTVAAAGGAAARIQATMAHGAFRPYASDDVTGTALGGAGKNVYAIACGIVEGMGLGESARAALLARSFAELSRLGTALGAKSETLMGLSGLGDLVLTATSVTSRNFAFGRALGSGTSLASLRAPDRPLAEGVETAAALAARARAVGIELPIAEAVAAVLDDGLPLDRAMAQLLRRPLKAE